VLIMAVVGPLIARAGDPLGRWVATKWPAKPKSTANTRTAPAVAEPDGV
jgi:hypothetical protein